MPTTVGQHGVTAFTSPSNGDALDATVVKANDNTLRSSYVNHDNDPGIHFQSSTLALRPSAGTVGRKWMTTDSGDVRIWHDNGSIWQEVSYVSSSGAVTLSDLTVTSSFDVDGTTLYVDVPNQRVGVGTSSPTVTLDVFGNVRAVSGVTVVNNGITIGNGGLTVVNGTTSIGAAIVGGTLGLVDNVLQRPRLQDYGEVRTTPSISAGTLTLNLENGNVFGVSLNANITTLTISNPSASGTACSFTLSLTADGTPRTVAWGASVKWANGNAPTLTSTNGKVDIFTFVTWDAGTNWYAFTAGQNF
jgi:hypothetical protein